MNTIRTALIVLMFMGGMMLSGGCSGIELPATTDEFSQDLEMWDNANATPLTITREALDALVYQNAAPVMVDYDGNGTMDLVVGYKSGYIEVILNTRVDGFEVADHYWMSDLAGPIYFCDDATPYLYDVDLDGKWEMAVGCGDGVVLYVDFNVMTPGNMQLWIYPAVSDGGIVTVPGGFAAPAVGDVNVNGLVDLVVGSGDGAFYYYDNVGSPGHPAITFADLGYDFGERAVIATMDLDENGILDGVIGNEKGEVWACSSPAGDCTLLFQTSELVKPAVGDYNHDGLLDMVYGTADGSIWMILAQP